MGRFKRGFKRGAASFYIVAFSTLILVIIATSFATVIISEVTRTSNDDLSQSAYDAALAGVEDAKLAFSNYRRCLEANPSLATNTPSGLSSGEAITCSDIVYWMTHPDTVGCDMVAHILGRIGKFDEGGEVKVSDTTSSDVNTTDMNQAYTCAKIETVLADYRANLSSSNQTKVVKVQFEKSGTADQINAVKLSWYSNRENEKLQFLNFNNSLTRVTFQPVDQLNTATPPTLAVELVQTARSFYLSDFDQTASGQTDRATLLLVPSSSATAARVRFNETPSATTSGNYVGVYNGSENVISAAQVAKTNDHNIGNVPYVTYCDEASKDEFACSVTINLPKPKNGARSDDTFMFVVTLPYAEPDTDFSMQFLCNSDCTTITDEAGGTVSSSNVARVRGVQVLIDSTGRANDLYRRVETRLESSDTSFPYIYYALQLLDSTKGATTLRKNLIVTRENNFYR